MPPPRCAPSNTTAVAGARQGVLVLLLLTLSGCSIAYDTSVLYLFCVPGILLVLGVWMGFFCDRWNQRTTYFVFYKKPLVAGFLLGLVWFGGVLWLSQKIPVVSIYQPETGPATTYVDARLPMLVFAFRLEAWTWLLWLEKLGFVVGTVLAVVVTTGLLARWRHVFWASPLIAVGLLSVIAGVVALKNFNHSWLLRTINVLWDATGDAFSLLIRIGQRGLRSLWVGPLLFRSVVLLWWLLLWLLPSFRSRRTAAAMPTS